MKGAPMVVAGVERTIWVPHSSRLYRDGWGCGSFAAGIGPVGFDFDGAGFAGLPVEETAPGPVFGILDEPALDGIAVDVLELLYEFGLGDDVEVVITGLPELGAGAFEELGSFALEDADGGCEWAKFWFGQEKVDVLRHEDVAEEVELVALAESFEGAEEGDAGLVVVQVGEPVVTTEG
jgi:hypothetical protein